jgi:ABC-type Fe3+/spermidine/putrescine transport system ATPase subunit
MSYLELEELEYRAGSFGLKVSLALEAGQTGVLLGPSGCGKTSLLRCVAGLERPSSGSIRVQGRQMTEVPPEGRNFGYVFQDLALFDHLTGRGNMEFGLKLRGWDRAAAGRRVEELAYKLRIEGLLDRRPLAMSGGERQRLAFARSIAFSPDLLLLDEPLSALDAPLRRELRTFLGESLRGEGMTALHVTHDVEEALELADLLFLMRDGRIVSRGSPRELYSHPQDAWTASFLGLGSLVPLKRIWIRGSVCMTESALGSIAVPDAELWLAGEGAREKPPLLFVPEAAVSLGCPEESPGFKAQVLRAVYAGGALKVSFQPIGLGEPKLEMEFKAEPSLGLTQGEIVELSVARGSSYLVSDNLGDERPRISATLPAESSGPSPDLQA